MTPSLTARFRSKPFYVEAVQVTEQNFEQAAEWCKGKIGQEMKQQFIRVRVSNPLRARHTKAFVGDWILYSEYYGYKVYNDGAFIRAFTPADEEVHADQLELLVKEEPATN